jgi:hypothetical protein
VVEGYTPVPFADFWGQFAFIERAMRGDLRIGDFWAQSNEHRIVLGRVEFLLEYRFFGGRYIFLFAVIVTSLLLTAALFAAVAWTATQDRLVSWGSFCVAAIALVSPAAWENLTWAFQGPFVQVFLFGVLAIASVVWAVRSRRRGMWTAVAAVAAIAATYSLANGLLVWLVLLALALRLGLGTRRTSLLAVAGALTAFSYLWHFQPVERHASYGESLSHPVELAKYVLVYLGSPLEQAGVWAAGIAGFVGVALCALLTGVAWRRHAMVATFGTGIAVFILLTAVETAVGRLNLGTEQALSSRYATASFVFWLGLLIGFLPAMRAFAPLYLGAAALIALAVGFEARPSRASLRSTVTGKELTVVAFRSGVTDTARTVTGTPPSPQVADALRWLQRHLLGPWAPGGMVDDARVELPAASISERCGGQIEAREVIGRGVRVVGHIEPPADRRASHDLVVVDSAGAELGFGLRGTDRSDGFVAYGRSRAARPHVVLVAPDHRTPLCRL